MHFKQNVQNFTLPDEREIKKIANGVVNYFRTYKLKPNLLLGTDGKAETDFVFTVFTSVLLKAGIYVDFAGVSTSPCLAFLTKKHAYPLGVCILTNKGNAISLFEFFNAKGEMCDEDFLARISSLSNKKSFLKGEFASLKNVEKLKHQYFLQLKSHIRFSLPLILNCPQTASNEVCRHIYSKQEKLTFEKTQTRNYGCDNLFLLRSFCSKKQKIGIDIGENGKVLQVVTQSGKILDSEKILFLLAKFYLSKNDTLVACNPAPEQCKTLLKIPIKTVKSSSDFSLIGEMQIHHSILGGDEKGEIIFEPYFKTSDAFLTSILLLNLVALTNLSLDQLLN